MKHTKISAILIALTFFAGCGKKNDVPENKTADKKESLSQQVQTRPETSIQQSQSDTINKSAGRQQKDGVTVKATPDEKRYLNDPKGQWAIDADASSTRANLSDDYDAGYSNIKLIGKPDVEAYGDNKNAWAPREPDKGLEWVKVFFAKPVNAIRNKIETDI